MSGPMVGLGLGPTSRTLETMDADVRDGRTNTGRRVATRLAPFLVGALLLAGCGGSSGDKVAQDSGTTVPGVTTADGSTTVPADASTTTEAPTTTTSTSTTTTVPPTTTTTLPVTEIQEPAGPIQSGSKGKRSMAVQVALKAQHYDPGEPDGKFGLKTTQSVWAFQALHGLPQTGVVTPELEAQILAKPVQAMLKPELGPTHTEVDLTRQVLIVWTNGAPTLITHVSSGSGNAYCEDTDQGRNCGDAKTPEGLFTFYRQVTGVRVAPLGKLYNPVYFTGGYAVHGAGSVPDHPASHGCVRIPMAISDYFQSLVTLGEKIEVFRS